MADISSNLSAPDAQIIKLLAVRQSILTQAARHRKSSTSAQDDAELALDCSDWDKGYAKGLRDAIDVITGIRPVAQRMDAESCLDGIAAIFNYMSVPEKS